MINNYTVIMYKTLIKNLYSSSSLNFDYETKNLVILAYNKRKNKLTFLKMSKI